jgi:hypothetical protein
MHIKEFHDLISSPNMLWTVISKRLWWAKYMTQREETKMHTEFVEELHEN